LEQVLLNLLRNATRHTLPGGIVVVLAKDEDETVRLEIRDTGQGIDPADLPHIWERFYRGKNATSESAGLGLALVRELVEAMGGNVGVESTAGEGSCFRVRLPKT
jgi:signal transduction histidine kinase